jgi:hypothetical protein
MIKNKTGGAGSPSQFPPAPWIFDIGASHSLIGIQGRAKTPQRAIKKWRLLDDICNLDKFLPSIRKAIFYVEFPHEKSGLGKKYCLSARSGWPTWKRHLMLLTL